MSDMYLVLIDGTPITDKGVIKEYTRSEAIKLTRENKGKFVKTTTDMTAITRRVFRMSDTDMYKLDKVAKKYYQTTNKSEALRGLINSAYDSMEEGG